MSIFLPLFSYKCKSYLINNIQNTIHYQIFSRYRMVYMSIYIGFFSHVLIPYAGMCVSRNALMPSFFPSRKNGNDKKSRKNTMNRNFNCKFYVVMLNHMASCSKERPLGTAENSNLSEECLLNFQLAML